MHVFLRNICIYKIFAVPLHPLLRNKRVSLFSREAFASGRKAGYKPRGY